jgi:hypothetical protein
MALNLINFLTSFENLLIKNNTTTSSYDISANLNERIRSFHKGANGFSESLAIANTRYPAVCVELARKEEDFSIMGNTGKRDLIIEVDVVPIIYYGFGSQTDDTTGRERANLECIQVSDDIEYLLRNKVHLSQTIVAQSRVGDTRYLDNQRESYYNCNSRIRVEVKIFSTS